MGRVAKNGMVDEMVGGWEMFEMKKVALGGKIKKIIYKKVMLHCIY